MERETVDNSTTFLLAWAYAVVSVGVGCGGTSGGTPSGSIPRDQLLAQFAAVMCDHLAPCCQAEGFAYDSASCRQRAQARLSDRNTLLSRTAVKYDPIAARQCLDAYASALPACSTNTDWGALPLDDIYEETAGVTSACRGVLTGTLPADANCVSDKECAQPEEGFAACSLGCSDTCNVYGTPAPRAMAGEPCATDCDVTEGSGSCYGPAATAANPVIAQCYSDDGLYCTYEAATGVSVCAPLAGVGEVCTSRGCAEGAVCSQAGDVCSPLPAIGDSCANAGYCVDGASCVAGTCVAPSDSGPCRTVGDEKTIVPGACSSAAYCDSSTGMCTPKRPDGAACTQGDSCLNDCVGIDGKGAPPGSSPDQGTCGKQPFPSRDSCLGNLQ
jgi:hypothetical protein